VGSPLRWSVGRNIGRSDGIKDRLDAGGALRLPAFSTRYCRAFGLGARYLWPWRVCAGSSVLCPDSQNQSAPSRDISTTWKAQTRRLAARVRRGGRIGRTRRVLQEPEPPRGFFVRSGGEPLTGQVLIVRALEVRDRAIPAHLQNPCGHGIHKLAVVRDDK